MIIQQGSINLTALIVPDIYVQVVPPGLSNLNGVPSNIIGAVGSAPWGPKNAPVPVGNMAQYSAAFGAIQARKYDLGTACAIAVQQGANNIKATRVTDGTDVAATTTVYVATPGAVSVAGTLYVVGDKITLTNGAVIQVSTLTGSTVATFAKVSEPTAATGGTLAQVSTTGVGTGFVSAAWTYTTGLTGTSLYTGTGANGDTITLATGSAANSYKVTLARPGQLPEIFDNITGATNALWIAIANAVNLGINNIRTPSQLMTLAAGAATGAPTLGTYTLTAGTDGAGSVSATTLLGADGTTRTGMFALRNSGASLGLLADTDTQSTWAAQLAFGLSEGMYMQVAGPAGETPTAAASSKSSAGIDSYGIKVLLGDWVYWNDTVNGQLRLCSPASFAAGRLASLSPQDSGLNKPMASVVGTQKSYSSQVYSAADLQILGTASIDVITNPCPGGAYFGLRFGRNASSNATIHGDNYTRLTNYIAGTLNAGLGSFIGKLQSADQRRRAKSVLSSFFDAMALAGMIGNAQGTTPYQITLDDSNNPPSQVALGTMRADVQVQFLSVIENFVVNVEGGQSVVISRGPISLAA